MDAFNTALTFTMREEGGFVDNPNDHGKATNHGITQKTYDQYRTSLALPLQTVRWITVKEVDDIYSQMYWSTAHCQDMPLELAVCHFDWAVNHGPSGAIRTLQQSLDVDVDGVYGPITHQAMLDAVEETQEDLIDEYLQQRLDWYKEDARKDPSQREFERSWIGRVFRLEEYLSQLSASPEGK